MRSGALVALAGLLALPWGLAGQESPIVGKQVAVDSDEATLSLELRDGTELTISLRDEAVVIDGAEIGEFEAGGELDRAWRGLLGQAVALEDGPLRGLLIEWTPPEELDGGERLLAARLDRALESMLRPSTEMGDVEVDFGFGSISINGDLITALLASSSRLAELSDALDGIDTEDITIRIGEDVLIERGETLEGTLLVIDGDVEVEGELDGDLVLVSGDFWVSRNGEVTGDVRLADSRVRLMDGEVQGEVREMDQRDERGAEVSDRQRLRDQIREEIRRDIEEEIARATEVERRESRGRDRGNGLFHSVGEGISDLVGNVVNLFVLGLLGCAIVYFGQSKLEVVAETAARNPVRAGAVGLAGAFLAVPVWILGAIALAISVIGIPVLLAWLPLFPLAMVFGAALGLYATAANLGELLSRQDYPYLRWIRSSNPYTLVVGGLVGLAIPFMLANTVSMAGNALGFLEGLLTMAGWVVVFWLMAVGFGAVILTRAGRRPEFYSGDPLDDIVWSDLEDTADLGNEGDDSWFGGSKGSSSTEEESDR